MLRYHRVVATLFIEYEKTLATVDVTYYYYT